MKKILSTTARSLADADLARSGLSLDDLTGVELVDDASKVLRSAPRMPALVFDYHEPWRPTGWVPRTEFCRLRLLGLPPTAPGQFQTTAPSRYLQPAASVNSVYLPKHPAIDWARVLLDPVEKIIITEGEKKAWAGANAGFSVSALGGVTMISAEGKGLRELDFFEQVRWERREVIVIFDTDTAGGLKPQVARAADRLLDLLLRKGAVPQLVVLPPKRDGQKRALDDYLVDEGGDGLAALIEHAQPLSAARSFFRLSERYTYITELGRFHDSKTATLITKEHLVTQEANTTVDQRVRRAVTLNGARVPKWVLDILPAGRAFIEWEARPEAARVVYEPGHVKLNGTGNLNVWPGWACGPPRKNDISEFMWALDNIYGDDPVAREFIEHWLFYPLRYPGAKLFTIALVTSPDEGIGKTFIFEMLARYVYGMQNATILQEGDLGGDYNSFLVNRQLVIGDDIAGSDAYRHLARIKSLVTNEYLVCKQKYVPEFTVANVANFAITANELPFKLNDDDRRFFAHWPRRAKRDLERYTRLSQAFRDGLGSAVLWHALERYDEAGFAPKGAAPDTACKRELISFGRNDIEAWASSLRERAEYLTRDWATLEELMALWLTEGGEGAARIGPQAVARVLGKFRFTRWRNGVTARVFGRPQRVWLLRNEAAWQLREADQFTVSAEKQQEFRIAQRPRLEAVPTKKRKF